LQSLQLSHSPLEAAKRQCGTPAWLELAPDFAHEGDGQITCRAVVGTWKLVCDDFVRQCRQVLYLHAIFPGFAAPDEPAEEHPDQRVVQVLEVGELHRFRQCSGPGPAKEIQLRFCVYSPLFTVG
jgi:hypothetical protein